MAIAHIAAKTVSYTIAGYAADAPPVENTRVVALEEHEAVGCIAEAVACISAVESVVEATGSAAVAKEDCN